ncbi:MAG: hypothetical protein QOF33_4511, partial [Thermomicrobiales bacterium]|nr:hypothetical protein [Thermomicrobiales bacterium]
AVDDRRDVVGVADVAADRSGGTAAAVGGDVSNPDDVAAIVDGLLTSHGRVDQTSPYDSPRMFAGGVANRAAM